MTDIAEEKIGAARPRAALGVFARAPFLVLSLVLHQLAWLVLGALGHAPIVEPARAASPAWTVVARPEPPPRTTADLAAGSLPEIARLDLLGDEPPTAFVLPPPPDESGDVDAEPGPPAAPPEPEVLPFPIPAAFECVLAPVRFGAGIRIARQFADSSERPRDPSERAAREAVERGLEWLAAHQGADGAWDCDGFSSRCRASATSVTSASATSVTSASATSVTSSNACSGKGHPLNDTGVTGLALLAFLRAGGRLDGGPHRATVSAALRRLVAQQDAEGCFPTRAATSFTYAHAIATAAVCEAYAASRFPLLARPARDAAAFAEACRGSGSAWRYGPRPADADSSVTAFMAMAVVAAESAGLPEALSLRADVAAFLDGVTEPNGRVGYTAPGTGPSRPRGLGILDAFPPEESESLTAAGISARLLLFGDAARDTEPVRLGVARCLHRLPEWRRDRLDFCYWLHGSCALAIVGGEPLEAWNRALRASALAGQARAGDERGSWPPDDVWGEEGGRVYSTAAVVLALEAGLDPPRR